MKLFIKERGASGNAQIQWEATTNVTKKTYHTFCVKLFVIEPFFYIHKHDIRFPCVNSHFK